MFVEPRQPIRLIVEPPWATFTDLPGRHLAETLAMVRKHGSARPLARTSGLSQEQKLSLEEKNVEKSLAFAREHLGL